MGAALRLFTERGFSGTSIADIQKEARVKRGSLYFHFPSKDGLAAEVLREFFEAVGAALAVELNGPLPLPLDALFKVFAAIRDRTVSDDFRGGCLLGGFAQEMIADDPARERIRAYFEQLVDAVAVFFERARAAGQLRPDLDPRAAARLFICAFHGALIELRVYRDPKVYDDTMDMLRRSYE